MPPDADGYLARGLAIRDALKHEAQPRVLAGAARAVHGERRNLEEDRRVRAPARPADPDASRRDGAGGRREPRRSMAARRLRRLHDLGVTGPQFIAIHGVHLAAEDIGTSRGARLPRRALPDLEHEARQRHRARRRAARKRRQRRARHRRRGVEQPPRSLRRNAHARRCSPRWPRAIRRCCPRSRRCTRPRSPARARSGSKNESARSSPARRRT